MPRSRSPIRQARIRRSSRRRRTPCDCHIHIYDPARFPMVPTQRVPPTDAAVPQYRLLQRRIGTTRVVIVTPRTYATQNQVTVDAIVQLGPNARGVAVVHPTVTNAELKRLHDAGVRPTGC